MLSTESEMCLDLPGVNPYAGFCLHSVVLNSALITIYECGASSSRLYAVDNDGYRGICRNSWLEHADHPIWNATF